MLAENDTPSFVLVNAIFLLGTFTFAVVLGVVSDDIGNELKVSFALQTPLQKHENKAPTVSQSREFSKPEQLLISMVYIGMSMLD